MANPDTEKLGYTIAIKGIEQVTTQLSNISTKVSRIQHLFKELNEAFVEIENDMNNMSVEIVPNRNNDKQIEG